MKVIFVVAVFAAAFVGCLAVSTEDELRATLDDATLSAMDKWSAYKTLFGKSYASDLDDEVAFIKFEATDGRINDHNSKGFSWTLGHNQFSDMTPSEFQEMMIPGSFEPREELDFADLSNVEVQAESLDWRTKGAVTPVKNQGQCGSCWAFSTTGAIEGAYAIATGSLVSFSEQELVSCDNSFHGGTDEGCNGGMMDNAFTWISKHGICTEADYPYTSGTGTTGLCQGGLSGPSCTAAASLTGHKDVESEADLLAAVNIGPVSVAIEADKSVFQSYRSGVIDSALCGTNLDHGVLVVGYGTDTSSGKDYWNIKNSWASSWGS